MPGLDDEHLPRRDMQGFSRIRCRLPLADTGPSPSFHSSDNEVSSKWDIRLQQNSGVFLQTPPSTMHTRARLSDAVIGGAQASNAT